MDTIIKVCDVEKFYGNKDTITKAVNRISFEVEKGEFTAIMGASGSGKTTLLNLLATVDQVTSGHIFMTIWDITTLKEEEVAKFRKENLGFVFQDFNLLDTLTLEEKCDSCHDTSQKKKQEIQQTVASVMRALGIWEYRKKFPYQVSGGQKQRCACARALVNHPKLILADEPTGALDSRSARMLLETFRMMNVQFGATILMVTHDAFSASYCKRILFLKDGAIFHELNRGKQDRRTFLNQILDVLSLTGGDLDVE